MTNDFDLMTVRKRLNAMRNRYGAQSQVGGRCSNLIEQLKNYPHTAGDQRERLEKFIAKSVEDLAKLTAA